MSPSVSGSKPPVHSRKSALRDPICAIVIMPRLSRVEPLLPNSVHAPFYRAAHRGCPSFGEATAAAARWDKADPPKRGGAEGALSPTESPRPPLECLMGGGPTGTAIDFYGSPFCKEVLDAAHPLRFSKERITYGSDIFDGFRGQIRQVNTEEDIAAGRRLVSARRLPLARLVAGSRRYGRLLDNILRPFGRRECKDHFLATYPDDKPVAFTILDFDRHPPKGRSEPLSIESDEWTAIDEAFWRKVEAFHRLAAALDLGVLWVQSPGRWLVDGHGLPCRMGGLYAVVRHGPRTPSELRPMQEAIKGRIGLDIEASWDTQHRNVRIPGQCFMDVCRVDPARRTIVPIRDPEARTGREMNMARLAAVVEGYAGLRRGGGERLLRAGAEHAAKGLATSPIGECGCQTPTAGPVGGRGRPAPSARPVGAGGCRGRIMRPSGGASTEGKRGSTSARHVRKPAPSDGADPTRWLREPDTFRALHGSGLLRQALRLFGWDPAQSGEAVSWMVPRFRALRPASSATCSDGRGLADFLTRHYLWGCRTYDPKKARASARAKARAEDEARIMPSLRVSDKALEAYLQVVAGLPRAEMESVRRFRRLERRYAGRTACRTLYAAFGGQRRFHTFLARHPVLHVAAGHSQSKGRCRQWTLAPNAVRSVRLLMASPVLLFMLCGEGGEVIYIETGRAGPRRGRPRRGRPGWIRRLGGRRRSRRSPDRALSGRGPPQGPPSADGIHSPTAIERAQGARRARYSPHSRGHRGRKQHGIPCFSRNGRDHGTTTRQGGSGMGRLIASLPGPDPSWEPRELEGIWEVVTYDADLKLEGDATAFAVTDHLLATNAHVVTHVADALPNGGHAHAAAGRSRPDLGWHTAEKARWDRRRVSISRGAHTRPRTRTSPMQDAACILPWRY